MGSRRLLTVAVAVAGLVALAPTAASASGGSGSGGGGGGSTPPPPTTAPAVTVSPTSLSFPGETTGTASPPQTAAVRNTGTGPLVVNGIRSVGTAALDYTIVDDQCSGVTVAPGGSCALTVVFAPTADGTRSSTFGILDNAPDSPQFLGLTGTGLGTGTGPTPLAIFTGGLPCANGVCDLTGGSGWIVGNFELDGFQATGGTAPYTWTATNVPAGFTFSSAGVLQGSGSAVGTFPFSITARDAVGASTTQQLTITIRPIPAPGPSGCQQGPGVREQLSGVAIGGKTPSGTASEDESKLTACGGYGVLTVAIKDVNLPNGTQLLVLLDSGAVGTITLSGGSGSMKPFVIERGLRFDHVEVTRIPQAFGQPDVLQGGSFG